MSDPTAERANAPGLTDEALKAERKRQKAAEKAVRKAAFRRNVAIAWDFILSHTLLWIGLAVVAAASAFDWYMSARGWLDLVPAMGVFAYLGAAASVGFWYVGVRLASESFREGRPFDGWKWVIVSISAYAICVTGVFIATSTNSVEWQRKARESRDAYFKLVADRDAMADQVELYPVTYWEQRRGSQERTLKAQLATARGTFGMEDLDADGACSAKLNFNQRRLCVHVNGGIDEHTGTPVIGLRAELEQTVNGLEKAKDNVEDLAKLQAAVEAYVIVEGDATGEAIAAMFDNKVKSETALGWLFVVLSALFMFCGGFLGDWVWEQVEKRRLEAEKKRAAAGKV